MGCAAQGRLEGLEPLQLHAQAGVEGELAAGGRDAPLAEELHVEGGGGPDGEARALPEARRRGGGGERRAQVRRGVRQLQAFSCMRSRRSAMAASEWIDQMVLTRRRGGVYVPMKSRMSLPSQLRPVGRPKKVEP